MYIYMTIVHNILLVTIIYLILTPQLCTRTLRSTTYSADLTEINGPSRTNPQLTADESETNNNLTRSRTMPLI